MSQHRNIAFIAALALLPLFPLQAALQGPVERWASATASPDKLAAVQSIYREATIQIAGMEGTIKAWHTADGRYRKEERVSSFTRIETFDGTRAQILEGDGPVRTLAGADLRRAISSAFANVNAMFFAFFPERRRGELIVEGDDRLVMKPAGGIDWHVTLDPATGLPKSMIHQEGERTVTVSFVSFETVDGLKMEKEIHRAPGDPRFNAVIRFTKTVLNPPIEASLFSIEATGLARE